MVYAQSRFRSGKLDAQTPPGFWDTNESSNLSQSTRLSDSEQKKKKRELLPNSGLCFSDRPQGKTKRKQKESEVLRPCLRTEKIMENVGDGDISCYWRTRYSHQNIGTGLEDLEIRGLWNKRTSGDLPNYCIVEIEQNTEKNPGDFKRLTVTQPPLESHQLMSKIITPQKANVVN